MEKNNVNLEVSKFAIECVENVKESTKKEYKTLVRKMPAMIQKNGLIGTLVFNLSNINKKQQHKEVLKNIIEWNIRNQRINDIVKDELNDIKKSENNNDYDEVKYIKCITRLNSQDYRLVTKEMMNLFGWIKRFADGMIEGE